MRQHPKTLADGHAKFSRRALVFGAAQLGVLGVLGYRMRALQLEQAEEFRLLAEENRINIRLLPPARGLVFDREGRPLAENEQNYRIVIVREDAGDVDAVLAYLARLIDLPPERLDRAREDIFKHRSFVPVTVADRLSWDAIARVSANAPALPGISAEVGLSRYYPRAGDTAHVLGYVGPVSDYDLSRIDDQDPLLQIPKFQIGKTGVENKLERSLRGSAGIRR
ncbi:MAG: penicillin-binding protein 2, partial [Pseudomonadota bacterium]